MSVHVYERHHVLRGRERLLAVGTVGVGTVRANKFDSIPDERHARRVLARVGRARSPALAHKSQALARLVASVKN